jgi:NADH-quinone oxidoreductase subunit G
VVALATLAGISAMSDTVTIEIDGKPYEAAKGEMLIAVTDRNGIRVPRFCYHKKLTVAANCRMCLVEVERAPKPLPACATPVMDGMKVRTSSPLARGAQKSVMEFLLINHPLDCPICDQGGECELQDVAMGYGGDVSRFVERKRVVPDKDIGPLIATDMTRCIHCTRCVRFGEEIAGLPELGATGRGENMQIGTYIEKSVDSELSGNVIDLCPVGALTNKPFRFRARTWEMRQHEAVSAHDGVGANLYVHVARNQVMRVVPRENEAVNEVWIADRDRYSHSGLYAEDRLHRPMVRNADAWVECDWEHALERAAEGLRSCVDRHGAGALGALAVAGSSLEEFYLLQRLIRGLGSGNVDHRLRELDFADQDAHPPVPGLGMPVDALQELQAVLVVGSNTRKEQPLVNHRLRKAVIGGGAVMTLNPMDYGFNYPLAEQLTVGPAQYAARLDQLAGDGPEMAAVRERLEAAERAAILLGPGVLNHPQAARLRALAATAAKRCGATLGMLHHGGNCAGAWIAGAVPHRGPGGGAAVPAGLDVRSMLEQPRQAYLLLGVEPELDCADSAAASAAMDSAELVVAVSAYDSPRLREYAHVLLPMGLFAETAGTWVNMAGRWQSAAGALAPPGEARPAWKILRVLGNVLGLDGFDYTEAFEVRDELAEMARALDPFAQAEFAAPSVGADGAEPAVLRIGDVPAYAVDAMVRRAPALQRTADARFTGLEIGPELARELGLRDGEQATVRQNGHSASFAVTINASLAPGCARLPSGVRETEGLGAGYGPIEVGPG